MITDPSLKSGLYRTDGLYCLGSSFSLYNATLADTAWPAANRAFYCPLNLPHDVVIGSFHIANATAVSGNIDLGIYDGASLTKIVSTGSTAHTPTNTMQIVTVTPTLIPRGFYLLAVAMDNTTGRNYGYIPPYYGLSALGCREQASAFPLPTTAVPVVLSTVSFFPTFGAVEVNH